MEAVKFMPNPNVRLVPATSEHLRFIESLAHEPSNAEFFRRQTPVNLWPKDHAHWWTSSFIVEDLDSGKLLGLLTLGAIDPQNRNFEFGLVLNKEACLPWSRREVSVAALKQLIEYAFDYLQYEKIYSKTLAHRESIFAGYEQWGFKKDGVLRSNVWFQNKFQDEVVYSLLKSDWGSK